MFQDYLGTYREAIASTSYAELPELQPAPFASLAEGGAGTAYALWRLGDTRRAKTWIAAAVADRKATAYDPVILSDDRRTSLIFARPGALWVQAMIVPATTTAYVRAASRPALLEQTSGAAGHLLAAMLLRTPPVRMIETLGERVLAAIRGRVATPWEPADANGFAHGWVGICYAALAVAPDQRWLVEAVAKLADLWAPPGVLPSFVASWCNGAAGTLLLWTKAFAISRDARFLDVARRTARVAIEASGQNRGLCCGDTGVAFALLGLDRIDRRGGWRAQAREIAAREIAAPRFVHSNGLYRGHPGLACLAAELLADEPRGFPAIDS